MIAPLRLPEPVANEESRRLTEARHVVAATLLDSEPHDDEAPPVRPWVAWLLVGWVLAVTGIYVALMIGAL